MDEQKIPLKRFLPGIAWFFIVGLLTLLPGDDIPKSDWLGSIVGFDKFVHASLFGALTFLFCLTYFKAPFSYRKKLNLFIRIAMAASVWGLTVEFLQKYYIPGRDFELLDWAADSLGAFVALWICKKLITHKFSKYSVSK